MEDRMICPGCGGSDLGTVWTWDDSQFSDHAHNVLGCEACGTVLVQRVWKSKGFTVILKTGETTTYQPNEDPFFYKYYAAVDGDYVLAVASGARALAENYPDCEVKRITREQHDAFERGESKILLMETCGKGRSKECRLTPPSKGKARD